MAFRLSFFKTPKHRVFQYNPIYWDPEKEAREERIDPQKKLELKRGSFQKALYASRRHPKGNVDKIRQLVIIVAIAALFIALIYFTKFFEIVMKSIA
ncbi:MAG: hypothetical protein FWH23_01455 [Bacteroidales bacterium]|nr:hypothetical protein [Bacteroidales bacterium]